MHPLRNPWRWIEIQTNTKSPEQNKHMCYGNQEVHMQIAVDLEGTDITRKSKSFPFIILHALEQYHPDNLNLEPC